MKYDWKTSMHIIHQQMVMSPVSRQEAKINTYQMLTDRGLPVPVDLEREMEEWADGQ